MSQLPSKLTPQKLNNRCQAFTIKILTKGDEASADGVCTCTLSIPITKIPNYDRALGLYLGEYVTYTRTEPRDISGTRSKYIRIFGGQENEFHEYYSLGDVDQYGNRDLFVPTGEEPIDTDKALVYFDCHNPFVECKLFHFNELRKQGILYYGKVWKDHDFKSRIYSTPSLLIVHRDEEYEFSFYNEIAEKKYIASFHYDGTDLVFDDIKLKPDTPKRFNRFDSHTRDYNNWRDDSSNGKSHNRDKRNNKYRKDRY